MEEQTAPASPSSAWLAELSQLEETPDPRPAPRARVIWMMRLLGLLLLAVMLGIVITDDLFLPGTRARLLDALVILAGGTAAFLIAAHSRRRNVEIERAYSSHLEGLSRRLRGLANRDSLTGLYNHGCFRERLSNELDRARRYGGAVSVLLLDVDRFKEVNDTYGHLMGDTLLAHVAQLIGSSVRSSDVAARYGGDEFAVILPEADRRAAEAMAGKLRSVISAARHWQGALLEGIGVGLSVGVATYPEDGRTADALLVAADAALYESKSKVQKTEPVGKGRKGFRRTA